MSISAWSFDNVPATFTWTVGNESEATISSDVVDGVSQTKRTVGIGLTEGTRNNFNANPGVTMVTYNPASNKMGTVAAAMVEYSVKMKKGVTFTLTGIDYDAIKQGTDGASYHWSYVVDGVESTPVEVPQDELLRDNNTSGTPALHHTHAVTAAAGREVAVRFYVSGFNTGKLLCLSALQLAGTVNGEEEVRAFTNFKIDFRSEPYTMVEPETLPSNVTISNEAYHGNQHGLQAGTITVVVDGPVKFTLGGCTYGNNIAVKKNGEDLITIDNKVGCDNSGVEGGYTKFVTWTYNVEEAATLSFTVNGFLPYFFAEACEFVPQVEVRYYDVDGKTLIGEPQIVDGGSALAYAYGADDVTVADGKAFRGWFNGTVLTATKVAEGTPLTEDLSLYAKATDIEEAILGKIYEYDFRPANFYFEDHEILSYSGNVSYNGSQHGWAFGNGSTLSIEVAGNALLSVGVCTYSNTSTTDVKDAAGTTVGQLDVTKETTADGSEQIIRYTGDATTLTFEFTATNYIHTLKVYNIADFPEKNESGYFEVAPGDAAGFILALTTAEAGDKIFLPNGTYDLGETCNTTINKNNISIIGQSMEGVIIKNAPDFHLEGLGSSVTLFIPKSVSGTYFQDLTIQNNMDYYAAIEAGLKGGRGAALQDEGTQTVLKNVRLLSFQDTYYSKTAGAKHYFEDCEIHGTVDFICGAASVYFKNNVLYCEKRNRNGSGQDVMTAHTGKDASGDKGYVFEGCTIKSECPVVSFGRAWGDDARTYFLNSLVDYSAGEFSFTGSGVQRWTITGMNGNPKEYGEYNTHLADGTVLTPTSNVVTFNKDSEVSMETVLSADRAAGLTMEYTLGEWSTTAKADATQAVCDLNNIDPAGIYLVEALNGNAEILVGAALMEEVFPEDSGITVRKANARGGFGKPAGDEPQGIEDINANANAKVVKIFRDGQVIILRDGKEFNIIGTQLR